MSVVTRLGRASVLVTLAALSACASSPDDVGSSESAVKVCGQTTVKGIDVYHGDNGGNPIDWNAVKNAGISFAFTKATESTNYKDASFPANWSGIKSAGMVRGAYHFFHADVDPAAQANYFLAYVGTVSKGDLLVLDLETANGQTQATIASHAQTFLSTVQKASGVTPFLYTSPAFLTSFTGLGGYPLWVANYGVTCPDVPAAWTTYTFWQSTGTGSLSALSGAVDLDTFNGTLADLVALGGNNPPPSDGGTSSDASVTSDASDGAVGAEPEPDSGNVGGNDSGADAGHPVDPIGQSGGCAVSEEPPRAGSGYGALAALAGAIAIASRRRRRV